MEKRGKIKMKEFELVHGLKVIGKTDKQVLEIYEWDGYWYLASAKSLWNINQFNPEDFEIYNGAVDVGEYDLEYNINKMKKYYLDKQYQDKRYPDTYYSYEQGAYDNLYFDTKWEAQAFAQYIQNFTTLLEPNEILEVMEEE